MTIEEETWKQIHDVVDVSDDDEEKIAILFTDRTSTIVKNVPYSIRLELPDNDADDWTENRIREFEITMNQRIDPFPKYLDKCSRIGCECVNAIKKLTYLDASTKDDDDDDDEEEEVVSNEKIFWSWIPCVEIRKRHYVKSNRRVVGRCTIEEWYPLLGYRRNPKKFLRVSLTRSHFAGVVKTNLENEIKKRGWACEVYDYHPDAVTSVMFLSSEVYVPSSSTSSTFEPYLGIAAYRWMRIVEGRDNEVDFKDVKISMTSNDRPRELTTMSFDIECSVTNRKFPNANVDPIFAMCVSVDGTKRYALTWRSADDDVTMPLTDDYETKVYDTESSMLLEFFRRIREEWDPDVITGHNVDNFDWPYVFGRCEKHGHLDVVRRGMSRIPGYKSTLMRDTAENRGNGMRSVVLSDVPGRVFLDEMQYAIANVNQTSYSLKHLSKVVLSIERRRNVVMNLDAMCEDEEEDEEEEKKNAENEKIDFDVHEIDSYFYGDGKKRRELLDYCVRDAELPIRLLKKWDAVRTLQGQCAVCGILMRQLLSSGTQGHLQKLVHEYAIAMRILIPKHRVDKATGEVDVPFFRSITSSSVDKEEEEEEEEKIVQTTLERFFPRSISSTSSSTDDLPIRARLARSSSSSSSSQKRQRTTITKKKKKKKSATYVGAQVLDVKVGFLERYVFTFDFKSLYPSLMRAHNLCLTTILPTKNDVAEDKKWTSPNGHEFVVASMRKGLLPRVVERLLTLRSATRVVQKRFVEYSDEWKVYEALQAAYKRYANSIYGATGATTGALNCVMVASAITAMGRDSIMRVKAYIETRGRLKSEFGEEFDGVEVVAGDTDSCFVMLPDGTTLERAMVFGEAMKRTINSDENLFKEEQEIEAECVWKNVVTLAKKRYAGLKWPMGKTIPEMSVKGWDSVRRGNGEYVRTTISVMTALILYSTTPEERKRRLQRYLRLRIERLMRESPTEREAHAANAAVFLIGGERITDEAARRTIPFRIPVDSLAFSSKWTRATYVSKPAHVAVAERWKRERPHDAPEIGNRVPFVLVHNTNKGSDASVSECAVPPYAALPHEIDYYAHYKRLKSCAEPIARHFLTKKESNDVFEFGRTLPNDYLQR